MGHMECECWLKENERMLVEERKEAHLMGTEITEANEDAIKAIIDTGSESSVIGKK